MTESTPPLTLIADETASGSAANAPPEPDTGLLGLAMLARFHGVAADPDQLAHDFKEPGRPFGVDQILLAAKHLGLKAKRVKTDWLRLERTPLPALAVDFDGNLGTQTTNGRPPLVDANTEYRLTGDAAVDVIHEALRRARDALFAELQRLYPVGMAGLNADVFSPINIQIDPNRNPGDPVNTNLIDHTAYLDGRRFDNRGLEISSRDILIGEGGIDWLQGGKGDDILIGGAGDDVYIYNAGDGNDRIIDSDRRGTIVINTAAGQQTYAIGAFLRDNAAGGQVWHSLDGAITLTHNSPWQLVLADGATLDLGDTLNDGDFGIDLIDTPAPVDYTRSIVGDLAPVEPPQHDDLGNLVVSGAAAPGRADDLYGSLGNDLIQSRGGDDWVDGKGGADKIEGGAGCDILNGDGGADLVIGGADADLLFGGDDDDRLFANDELPLTAVDSQGGGPGRELLAGGDGADQLIGAGSADLLLGGGGADLILGGAGDDDIMGDRDVATQGRTWEAVRRTTPNGGSIEYAIDFGSGFIWSQEQPGGADSLQGGAGNDWLFAGGGDDFVDGGSDDDILFGADGSDVLVGGSGADRLFGDFGDLPAGAEGRDWLYGADGDDILQADGGDDILVGGSGADILKGGSGNDRYLVEAGDGADSLIDEAGDDTLAIARSFADAQVVKLENDPAGFALAWDDQSIALGGGLKGAIEHFEFADGTRTLAQVLARLAEPVAYGSGDGGSVANADGTASAYGGAGGDSIAGSDTPTVFNAGGGDDTTQAGQGADSHRYALGDGRDRIANAGGADPDMCHRAQPPITFVQYSARREYCSLPPRYSKRICRQPVALPGKGEVRTSCLAGRATGGAGRARPWRCGVPAGYTVTRGRLPRYSSEPTATIR